ncbi:Ig-like domain-containing protein [Lacticaseibacillus sharpeae]|uniref:BIG2 domain-containing protein n=1 Tax=Lacticaseibacillus sharpeae JCM 1186 = DSM 20505 TaxID=1291052 RepID=A0A0R1ZI19_9LACO|nr:Ig-like domain-containing protein [Lacticaseibacillus sharpeae]KRM54616.1 hypothetical protein FC18_GL002326 [Lacticaseibacillus sharpeae JCM 1186 = DSM 20505]
MAKLAIFKKGEDTPLVTSGDDGKAAITGLSPETAVAAGDYQAALTDGNKYGDKVDVPAFTTLPDYAAKGTAAGKADGDAGKTAADNSSQPQEYQDAYTAAYTPAKAVFDAAQPKPATGIKLQATMSLKVGDTKKPTLAADPADAADAAAVVAATTYKSSDETIATVAADGTITAVAAGTATITATSGTFTGDCKVTVAAAA